MSNLSQWNEAQKDDIVRCQTKNAFIREKLHLTYKDSNTLDSFTPASKQIESLNKQRADILNYVKENFNIQSYKELKETANEITHERAVTKEFERQLDKNFTPEPRKLTPYEEYERKVAEHYERERRGFSRGHDHDQTQGHEH